ncbi:MAG: hydroxymethylglutaryl-CoA reductase [Legionellaceae bacterium]|nr:hydroxymethylglutaryl-CoA reductase [Legionellaceae bacterium]
MKLKAPVPMKLIGPIKLVGDQLDDEVNVPMATFESTLWPSTNRGAKVSRAAGGIHVAIVDERMTRSIALRALNAEHALQVLKQLNRQQEEMAKLVEQTSRYCKLLNLHSQIVGNMLYLRFEYSTGDAAGHNMVTLASECLQQRILEIFPDLEYVSLSGNYCVDKKVSSVNAILGRGKYVVAEVTIPKGVCEKILKTTPEKIADLCVKKNLLGSVIAGSTHSANAHFANLLLATYLATGQDAANIVEGSQGITFAEVRNGDLYFSVTLPNIIVGTVGHGKDLEFVKENLSVMGCLEERPVGDNARRLAMIIAATVLCGELSLMAALTDPHELMRAHKTFERRATESVSS